MGAVFSLLEYRYARLYREQVALWRSRGAGHGLCHLIAAHVCRGEFVGRIRPAAREALDARLRKEPWLPSRLTGDASPPQREAGGRR